MDGVGGLSGNAMGSSSAGTASHERFAQGSLLGQPTGTGVVGALPPPAVTSRLTAGGRTVLPMSG